MSRLALIVLAAALTAPGDHDVVPGERLGKVRLGMRSDDVHVALGMPSGVADRSDGLREEWWSGGRNDVQEVRVFFEHGTAVQVSATSGAFRTKEGLSTASDPAAIVRLGLRRFGFETRGSGGGFAFYYDDVGRGVAWHISGTGVPRQGQRPFWIYAVIVHARNRAVVVNEKFIPAEADEHCSPDTPAGCE